jgi:hypothetical protein
MKSFALSLSLLFACSEAPSFELPVAGHARVTDPGPGVTNPSTQVIVLEFLPEYQEALERFGLAEADRAVRSAVRMHMRENFAAYDVAVFLGDEAPFSYAAPDQTMTIEVNGIQPDGMRMPHYFNTALGKDVGNSIRNEFIGGSNPVLKGEGLPSYGGIFIDSHFEMWKDTPRFQRLFAAVAPELGGEPLERFPGSRNDEAAEPLVSVFGALIASSAITLAAYAVGAPAGTDDAHTSNDEGCYTDAGFVRTFEERAKLDGQSEHFCEADVQYLDLILAR